MYGFYAHGSETMVCQHVADWSRQVLSYIQGLREGRASPDLLGGWRERFAAIEDQAAVLLNPWHWETQGAGAVSRLMEQAYSALAEFRGAVEQISPGLAEAKVKGWEQAGPQEGMEGEVVPGGMDPVPIGQHRLPELPYPYDALEPHLDGQTMRLHHDKHHKAYVDGLNKAERKMQEARESGSLDLIKHWEREVAFNGAGHYLHTLFWFTMSPEGGGMPTGRLLDQIDRDFGGVPKFTEHFSAAAEKVEGSGWAIWVWSPRANRTEILMAEKHQNLTQWEAIPLLVLDLWEHAYYLKYQNDRKAFINAWWNLVDWPAVNRRYEQARRLTWESL